LFATLAERYINVAAKGLTGIVGQRNFKTESVDSRETRRSGS
jgi:hypothetical protein